MGGEVGHEQVVLPYKSHFTAIGREGGVLLLAVFRQLDQRFCP